MTSGHRTAASQNITKTSIATTHSGAGRYSQLPVTRDRIWWKRPRLRFRQHLFLAWGFCAPPGGTVARQLLVNMFACCNAVGLQRMLTTRRRGSRSARGLLRHTFYTWQILEELMPATLLCCGARTATRHGA